MSSFADALLGVRSTADVATVRLVLPQLHGAGVFAGVRTAVSAACFLSRHLERPLRVVLPRDPADEGSARTLTAWLRDGLRGDPFADAFTVTSLERDPHEAFHPADVWIVTYWTTAVAAARACHAGLLDPGRVVYLVQDYEPGFFGWSDDAVMAATTYRESFHVVVNSSPLARYLRDQTGITVPPEQVFAPAVDTAALRRVAERWEPDPDGRIRVLFYGRPRHPRNLFRIGLEALRLWVETIQHDDLPLLRSAGDEHPPYALGSSTVLEPLGTLTMEAYLDLLARTDLALALMFSPHPSHLSLEPPLAGIPTVTNRFGSYRRPWVRGLHVAEPDPASLAQALAAVAADARGMTGHRARALPKRLGRPLVDAMRAVAGRL